MTHRGIIGAGLILFALWLQALAPVVGLRMLGASADPLAGTVICSRMPAGDQAGPAEPEQHAGCSLCALCTAGLAAIPLPPVPASVALPAGIWRVVSWPIPPPAPLSAPDHPPGQPRAPPTLA
ncbi:MULTISPECIES: DUF2946 family protein [Methylobacterium]|uniref:DUF2946 domain-containing protein n=1 Tax=Methylobacterium thuringiense TaxID=1003091 RepID=A0ABQ4TI63_9HYPH|nr:MULTISPECIES: DUF2946 family protein [Methylobacterium]GJE53884.1 hypothetical protein EKPJFOCH_0352 [Methylobacterium thuringiense]